MASTESTTAAVDNEQSVSGNKAVSISAVLRILSIVLWVFTFVLLLIALIVLCTNSKTIGYSLETGEEVVLHFQDIYAYRYMLSAIIIGIAYTLLRLGLSTYHIIIAGKGNILFDFYGDKIVSYLLATGAAAGFGVTVDMKSYFDNSYLESIDEFCSMGYASASLLLIAFLCAASSSIMSSYALTKRV